MPYAEPIRRFARAHWKAILGTVGALAAAVPFGAILVAWLGLYNVAASVDHWYPIELFLRFGMENSVEARAPDETATDLENPDLIRLGAAHYYAGCAYCHGAPGQPITPVSRHMLPAPPDLSDHVSKWSDGELFWIVKHGLKYTGMPAWPVQSRDDEIWAVVAFTRTLPGLTEERYRDLALGGVEIEPRAAQEIATGSGTSDAVDACARCHGSRAAGPLSSHVPRLHGQTVEMLLAALHQYRDGTRASGIMQTAVVGLGDAQLNKLAEYYAALPPLPANTGMSADIEAGRELALRGRPDKKIPACTSCHDRTALAAYPRLAGQNAAYMQSRLKAWKEGHEDNTATARIMAPIARRLGTDDIANVSAFFASLNDGETAQ